MLFVCVYDYGEEIPSLMVSCDDIKSIGDGLEITKEQIVTTVSDYAFYTVVDYDDFILRHVKAIADAWPRSYSDTGLRYEDRKSRGNSPIAGDSNDPAAD